MKIVWIVDIDITIAEAVNREHLLVKECVVCGSSVPFKGSFCANCNNDTLIIPQNSWDSFMDPRLMETDVPNSTAQKVIKKAKKFDIDIHYITGRNDEVRSATQNWLERHFYFSPGENKLLMRTESGPASVHKEKKLKDLIEMCGYTDQDLFFFFEDDDHVISMYSHYGIVMKAPACWETMWSPKPCLREPFIKR